MRIMLLMTAMLGSSAAIAQTDSSATGTTPPPAAAPAPEKKVCRLEGETGSLMSKKVCHTKTEWNTIDANNESNISRFRDRPRANNRQLQ